eukprot:2931906-Pyramimonas_sp.AAC.1
MDCSGPASGEARARLADPGPGSTLSSPGGRATTAHPAQAIWAPPSMKAPSAHRSGAAKGTPSS